VKNEISYFPKLMKIAAKRISTSKFCHVNKQTLFCKCNKDFETSQILVQMVITVAEKATLLTRCLTDFIVSTMDGCATTGSTVNWRYAQNNESLNDFATQHISLDKHNVLTSIKRVISLPRGREYMLFNCLSPQNS